MFRFSLEKYKGSKSRFVCPECGQKGKFTRYLDSQTGHYLAEEVGICSRRVNCGYHYPPKEYFADHPSVGISVSNNRIRPITRSASEHEGFDTIDKKIFMGTLKSRTGNNFITFLEAHFETGKVRSASEMYAIGTWQDRRTVFWQVDYVFKIRTGKLMTYDPLNGKRRKDCPPSWVHAEIKKQSARSKSDPVSNSNFRLKQCFFGEHLLSKLRDKPVAVVESEKTAIIASIVFPRYLWMATGGCMNLKLKRLVRSSGNRTITLFPDSTQFEKWSELAEVQNRRSGMTLVSDLLEKRLDPEQKKCDMDLADLILELMPRQKRP